MQLLLLYNTSDRERKQEINTLKIHIKKGGEAPIW